MQEKYLVSVIIPVYNSSLYLQDILDDIKKQTYKNLEIIVIDDGSSDNSSQICDNYVNSYKNIHIREYRFIPFKMVDNPGQEILDCVLRRDSLSDSLMQMTEFRQIP